jgi:HSP90 family molecular chaperone
VVHIGAGEMAKGFYLEISDTGVGMSSEKISREHACSEGTVSESGTAGEKGARIGAAAGQGTDR